ncbi:MAG: hypothetical protein JST02_06130, partial [Bacteroidetes bacterium]|nr:hypothetical protein [Bacteroidota bacterium]
MIKIIFTSFVIVLWGCGQSRTDNSIQPKDPVIEKIDTPKLKDESQLITDKLKNADSILLISHASGEIGSEIIKGGALNEKIVTQRKLITGKSFDSLLTILSSPTQKDSIVSSKCFDPHHS